MKKQKPIDPKMIELCRYTVNQHLGDNDNYYEPAFSNAQELLEASK